MNSVTATLHRLAFVLLGIAVILAPIAQQPVAYAAASADEGPGFSQQELDELLAPIALYPDALLAQVLMAATYPMEIVAAARWAKENPDVTGDALEEALQGEDWDPAVKAVAAVPQVLTMMDEKLDWTQKLGDAFLAQQDEVMATAQKLREKAKEAGNLESTEQQTVKTETQDEKTVVIIESTKPDVIYVPAYNPTIVYGTWWYSSPPPYYYYPPGYVAAPGLWFTAGLIVGGAIWGGFHWGRNEINININRYNSFNRTNIKNSNWNHNPSHRKGVAYRDQATAQKFNRAGDRAAVQSREKFRGRAEQGRAELKTMDRGDLDKKIGSADRSATRDLGARKDAPRSRDLSSRSTSDIGTKRDRAERPAGNRNFSDTRGGGFSDARNGKASRASSARGRESLGSRGGGGLRGGGRR